MSTGGCVMEHDIPFIARLRHVSHRQHPFSRVTKRGDRRAAAHGSGVRPRLGQRGQGTTPEPSNPVVAEETVNPTDNSVSVIRTDSKHVLTTIKVGNEPQSVALDRSNRFAYVANAASNNVSVIRKSIIHLSIKVAVLEFAPELS